MQTNGLVYDMRTMPLVYMLICNNIIIIIP